MHLYLDHIVVAVHDLDQAIQDYAALGFTVLPGGVHSNGATHNALIAFADGSYIELLASTGATPIPGLIDWSILTQNGEGLVGYALRTEDLDAEAVRLKADEVAVGKIMPGERQRGDGAIVRWALMQINNDFVPFFIQDLTPHHLRVPSDAISTSHANGAIGLTGVELAVKSLSESSDHLQKILDLSPNQIRQADVLPLRTGAIYLSQANPDAFNPATVPPAELREVDLKAALAHANKSEALFAVHIAFDNAPGKHFTTEATHHLRMEWQRGGSQ